MNCPHCNKRINPKLIKSEAARAAQKKRVYRTKDRPCPKCGQPFGGRAIREHIPRCTGSNE